MPKTSLKTQDDVLRDTIVAELDRLEWSVDHLVDLLPSGYKPHRTTVYKWIRGDTSIRSSVVSAMMKVLGLEVKRAPRRWQG